MNSVVMLMEKIVTMVFLFGLRTEVGWSKKKKKVVMMVGIWSEVGQSDQVHLDCFQESADCLRGTVMNSDLVESLLG